ncbi:MAG: hypothetical protein JWO06_752, partial [Bacteroidota bacterium]|nr:hypothetical protein [Bacteroidota bacterium]
AIQNVSSDRSIQIFPVPASNSVTLQLPGNWNAAPVITIENVLGEIVSPLNTDIEKNQVHINIQNLASGLYLVKCSINAELMTGVFMKE